MLAVADPMAPHAGFASPLLAVDDHGGDLIYLMFDVILGSSKSSPAQVQPAVRCCTRRQV